MENTRPAPLSKIVCFIVAFLQIHHQPASNNGCGYPVTWCPLPLIMFRKCWEASRLFAVATRAGGYCTMCLQQAPQVLKESFFLYTIGAPLLCFFAHPIFAV